MNGKASKTRRELKQKPGVLSKIFPSVSLSYRSGSVTYAGGTEIDEAAGRVLVCGGRGLAREVSPSIYSKIVRAAKALKTFGLISQGKYII